ncbi:SsrA-binding protein SmpB [Candidatus Erwinia haradaeae]|uniref:SsrA-binding protein n=1 Tax=Candidatus Erwinia haradaeae TaxID=1922217 RepID=A0A451DIL8_9GAMM|nr:SsrA-binding protein SmpB [Candidatus Erwinia haradaeae]VFP86451.1 SsrA-binding protein [Candidatus Erwinia haradaeae]
MNKFTQPVCISIAMNKYAYYSYFIEKEFEAGLLLKGWEVKALRAGQVNIRDSYILLDSKEAFLIGSTISALHLVSSDMQCDARRARKLLLSKQELSVLSNIVQDHGCSVISLSMYWKNAWVKLKIGVGKGKKQYDKRETIKERNWKLEKIRMIKNKFLTK